ncbi:UNVERIFIED_CONTAM: hypothetical protein FKN15_059533 [Acipenser sinensis]
MSDLRRVSLRSSHTDLPLKIGLHRTPSKSPLNLRKHLKKVNIDRSPGGTPLYEKENRETGTGLTPIMTQALRRKFQARLQFSHYNTHTLCVSFAVQSI